MPIFSKTDDTRSINLPRFLNKAVDKVADATNYRDKLKVMTTYADVLGKCHDDLVETFGDDVRCKAILRKHGLEG